MTDDLPTLHDTRTSAPPPPTESALLAGRYRVISLLGAGGMGTVYLAHDVQLGEPVAVKLFHPSSNASSNDEVPDALRHEVKLARRVTHPNVARTYDIGSHEGTSLLTMEFIEGDTLADLLGRRGALGLGEVARIASAVCAGLGAAHDAGIVHRDLKPTNVLLGKDGRIVISDFGVAVLAVDSGAADDFGGTPAYMAPEQHEGGRLDRRTDVYAFGLVLYEMLTGKRAVRHGTWGKVPRVDLARPPAIPEEVWSVVVRCLARAPDDRFGDAREIAAALATAWPSPSAMRARATPAETNDPGGQARARVVVVLPFTNEGDAVDARLADGFASVLMDAVDSTTVRVARAAKPDDSFAADVGAQAVVRGAFHRRGDDLDVTLNVESLPDRITLLHRSLHLRISDAIRGAYEAASLVRGALAVSAVAAPTSAGAAPADAVEHYLLGMNEYRKTKVAAPSIAPGGRGKERPGTRQSAASRAEVYGAAPRAPGDLELG